MCPVTDVMTLPEANSAAREATAVVSMVKRAPKRRRNRPGPRGDLYDPAIPAVLHHHPACVAREAPGRFRGNVRAVLEDRLAGRIRVRERRGIDVDHDLVSLSRRARIDTVMERRLRQQRERVRLLLRHRRRIC